MKKLLITGASGLLGRNLVKHCSSRFEVHGTYSTRDYKPDNIDLRHLDLRKPEEIESCLDAISPAIVIHCAGLTDIQYCQANQKEAEEVNYRASAQLAAFCTQKGIRLVFLSSDMVFDGGKGNYKEDDNSRPKNHYGLTKIKAEEAVRGICENYVIARMNLIYGHGDAQKKTFTDRILIANWSGKPYPIFKGQVRSPISLDTASRAIRELVEGDFKGIFHLGGTDALDRWNFALKAATYFKMNSSLVEESEIPEELKAIYPENTSFNISKVKSELKTEMLSIDEGLKLEYGKYLG